MATFKKFSELPEITEASESTKVPVLDGGEMKLLNGAKLGGDAGIKTAIIKSSDYDGMLVAMTSESSAGPEPMSDTDATFACTNMTFDEAYQMVKNGKPLTAIGMLVYQNAPVNLQGTIVFGGIAMFGVPAMIVEFIHRSNTVVTLFWTADGLSTTAPSSGEPS